MDWGMASRMNRVIAEDGRCFFLAIDHGYFLGPTRRLERPGEIVDSVGRYADALFVTRGVLRSSVAPSSRVPIVLRVSGGSSILGDITRESVTTSVEEAIRLDAAAVGVSIFVGSENEHTTLMNLAELVNESERYGIPVMAVTAVGKELEKRDARYLALACRIAAELGARVVKTYWCEDFEKVTENCPVPVVIAGGPRTDSEIEVFRFVHDGMQRGAIGVNLGRNVWQHDQPIAMAKALRGVVHDSLSPEDALEIFESERAVASKQ